MSLTNQIGIAEGRPTDAQGKLYAHATTTSSGVPAAGLSGARPLSNNKEENIMTFEHWLAFAPTSLVLLIIPGPTILLVIGDALAHRAAARLPRWPGWRRI